MPLIGAIVNPYFMPAGREIAAITNADIAEVTTTFAHGYLDGAIVRLYIPKNFGMEQADGLIVTIAVTSPTQFLITLDTTTYDPFVIPPLQPGWNLTPAQVIPVGEQTDHLDSSFKNILTPQI
jgi:hypothetical protein